MKLTKSTWVCLATAVALMVSPVAAQQELPTNVEAGQLADAIAQTAGEYDAMNLGYIQSFGMQQKAWNDPMSHLGEGQTKPGYSRYIWSPEVVLPIRLREGMMTLINLPTWELIEKVHIGSPESFGGEIAAPNSLLIYADPNYIGVDSNMIVFGRSGNRYVFYLRSETYNTDKITHSVVDVLTGAKFTPVSAGGNLPDFSGATATAAGLGATATGGNNPVPGWAGRGGMTPGGAQNPQIGLNTASTGPSDWLQSIPIDPEKFRFDIEIFLPNPADIDIAPERVWRDEIFTYIDLGPKALTMTQRPVVNLIIQDSEVPVGFRTRGKNSRLIIVEAVGDLVLRNGRKLVCLKLRRDPTMGLEHVDYSGSDKAFSNWTAPATNVGANGAAGVGAGTGAGVRAGASGSTVGSEPRVGVDAEKAALDELYANPVFTQKMVPLPAIPLTVNVPQATAGIASVIGQVSTGTGVPRGQISGTMTDTETISIELAANPEISALESVWEQVIAANADILKNYEPYYSIDTTADGDVRELFRLRVGPIKDVRTADAVCQKLGSRGQACSVIRVQ